VVQAAADAPAPVRSAVDRLLGGAARADSRAGEPDDEQRLGLYAAVVFVVARVALDRPLLLVIENAERIDRASSLLLRHLVGRLPAATAVVVSYRDPPGGRHLPLLELLGDAGSRDLTERVFLGPLSEPETADLVRSVLPDADQVLVRRVWQHTGGNRTSPPS
jgi:predicted ATPase